MSLIGFHRVLIASAIVFCAGFGVWQLFAFTRHGRMSDLLLSFAFGIAAGALILYLLFLRRVLRLPNRTPGPRTGRQP
jgi:cytochrome b561